MIVYQIIYITLPTFVTLPRVLGIRGLAFVRIQNMVYVQSTVDCVLIVMALTCVLSSVACWSTLLGNSINHRYYSLIAAITAYNSQDAVCIIAVVLTANILMIKIKSCLCCGIGDSRASTNMKP